MHIYSRTGVVSLHVSFGNMTTHRHSCNYTPGFPVGPPSDCFLATDLFFYWPSCKKAGHDVQGWSLQIKGQRLRNSETQNQVGLICAEQKRELRSGKPRSEELGKQLVFFLKPGMQRWFSDIFRVFFFKWQVDLCPNMPVVFGFSWWNFDVLGVCCSPYQYSHYSHEAPTQSLTSHGANMCKWCDRLR